MAFPKLRVPLSSRQTVDVFGGYNHNLRIGDGEFYDMKNLTSDDYPVLSTRRSRGLYKTGEKLGGLIAKDSLCYVEDGLFYVNGYDVGLTLETECDHCAQKGWCAAYEAGKTVCKKQLISMGAYVIIMPDKKYINTEDFSDYGDIEAVFETDGSEVSFTMCREDGSAYDQNIGKEEPKGPEDGQMWIDTSVTPNALKQWSASSGMWIQIAATYVKISFPGIGRKFERYDGIRISGLSGELKVDGDDTQIPELAALEGDAVVWDKGDNFITVIGVLPVVYKIYSKITVSRLMPHMDYMIECGNRLWGCRYGVARNGQVVNEIYGSKLGDFKNWNCYMGISTDSWTANVGTDGQFTGAWSYLGNPLFFKENHLHKVYIDGNGAHRLVDTPCRGVQRGCGGSLAMVGNVLYYKSRNGVCVYDGSLPAEISQALGNISYFDAVGGGIGNKYYVSMNDSEGAAHLFVYDMGKGLWHKEDDLRVDAFCECRGELYAISKKKILTMRGSGELLEKDMEWMAQTGIIGLNTPDMKYISRLTLRMQLPQGSCLRAFAEYDSSGRFEQIFTVHGHGMQAFTLPVRPVRCDHMRLRLEGKGPMKLFSVTKTIEQGSDTR